MFIPEPKTFYDSIKPLIYLNCITGNGVLRQPNQSNTVYFLMILYTVIYSLFNWTMIYITLNGIAGVIASDNASTMAFKMRILLISANSCMTVIGPFLMWLSRKVLKDCLQRIPILDNTFQTILGVPNEYRKQYIRLIFRAIGINLVMTLVGLYDIVFGPSIELQLSMQSTLMFCAVTQTLHQPIAVMLLLDVNFCIIVGYVGEKFRNLNDTLLRLSGQASISRPGEKLFTMSQKIVPKNKIKNIVVAEGPINDKHYLLREIRKTHLELCKFSRKINLVFGIQNLLSTGISFVMITGLLYTIYSAIAWEKLDEIGRNELISSAMWTALYILKIWMVNHTCSSVSNEAENTGDVLYELLTCRLDEKLEKEIQRFGIQMLQNPVRFNACGFFTLDHTFVQGVIGSITTYLIILIQMSHASESFTSDTTSVAWNNTEITPN